MLLYNFTCTCVFAIFTLKLLYESEWAYIRKISKYFFNLPKKTKNKKTQHWCIRNYLPANISLKMRSNVIESNHCSCMWSLCSCIVGKYNATVSACVMATNAEAAMIDKACVALVIFYYDKGDMVVSSASQVVSLHLRVFSNNWLAAAKGQVRIQLKALWYSYVWLGGSVWWLCISCVCPKAGHSLHDWIRT